MPWKPAATSNLQREIDTLQIKLLQANAALRLKTIYAERLEVLLHQRNAHIDELRGKLELAWQRNKKLAAEAEHLTQLLARPHLNTVPVPESAE